MHPMVLKVYQSALQEKISIMGNGFKEGMTFNFEPDLKVRSLFVLSVSLFVCSYSVDLFICLRVCHRNSRIVCLNMSF